MDGNETLDGGDAGCESLTTALKSFNRFYMPAVIVAGVLGNLLSTMTFMLTELRRLPSSHYLTALAVADTGMLLCQVMLMVGADSALPGLCKLTFYCGGVFSFLSVWYVVSFTLERYVAVRFPLRRLQWCTVSRTRRVVIGVTAFACFHYSYILFAFDHQATNEFGRPNLTVCDVHNSFVGFVSVYNHIDTALTFVVPVVMIVVLNAGIAVTVLCPRSRKQPGRTFSKTQPANTTALLVVAGEALLTGTSRRHFRRQMNDDRKLTRMLLVVSLVFLLMNFPDHLVRMAIVAAVNTGAWDRWTPSTQCRMYALQMLANVLFNSNFAVNFFLYSLVGVTFRLHLRRLLRRFVAFLSLSLTRSTDAKQRTISSSWRVGVGLTRVGVTTGVYRRDPAALTFARTTTAVSGYRTTAVADHAFVRRPRLSTVSSLDALQVRRLSVSRSASEKLFPNCLRGNSVLPDQQAAHL